MEAKPRLTYVLFGKDFPNLAHYLEEGTDEDAQDMSITCIRPLDPDLWIAGETYRRHQQLQNLKVLKLKNLAIETANKITPKSGQRRPLSEIVKSIFEKFKVRPYPKARIHRVDSQPDNPREFISNQPNLFLDMLPEQGENSPRMASTRAAFGTSVEYGRDIFYFTDNRGPDDILKLAMFLNSTAARLIGTLAISHWLFQVIHEYLPASLNGLIEIKVVWEEPRTWEERWLSKIVIKDIEEETAAVSQDQNRSNELIEVRKLLKTRNPSKHNGENRIRFSIGVVEVKEAD
ncbi:hypothetical protein VTL71DRAFT_13552 [Oculimacula yallundae]|uniref:Uncharacterized protein n=1 Tax=Oculimacula yallundae TaxID=86028 RepID=A0ABR4CKN8_9HELO